MIFYPLRLAGYSLLSVGVINLFSRYIFGLELLKSIPGRLSISNSLVAFAPWLLLSLALIFLEGNRSRRSREHLPVQLLHRLLLPLLVGYLLLVPLMIRDAIGYNRSVQSEISSQLKSYRNGTRQLLDQVAPLSTPLAVAQVIQRYPSIAMAVLPTETASQVKAKLAKALSDGEDYELLATFPPDIWPDLSAAWRLQVPRLPLTAIGTLTAPDIKSPPLSGGWDHFPSP